MVLAQLSQEGCSHLRMPICHNLSLFPKHFLFPVRTNFSPLTLVFVMFVVVCIHVSDWLTLWDRQFLTLSLNPLPGHEPMCLTVSQFWLNLNLSFVGQNKLAWWIDAMSTELECRGLLGDEKGVGKGRERQKDASSEGKWQEWSGWERLGARSGAWRWVPLGYLWLCQLGNIRQPDASTWL